MLQYYAVYFIWFHQINFFSKIADLPVLAEKKKKKKKKEKNFYWDMTIFATGK